MLQPAKPSDDYIGWRVEFKKFNWSFLLVDRSTINIRDLPYISHTRHVNRVVSRTARTSSHDYNKNHLYCV